MLIRIRTKLNVNCHFFILTIDKIMFTVVNVLPSVILPVSEFAIDVKNFGQKRLLLIKDKS